MQEAEELYDLREAMEAFAVEGVTARLTQAALEQLRRKIDCCGENVPKRFSRARKTRRSHRRGAEGAE
jgi:DNA-binding GntR family transcriptional regulator